MNLFKSYVLFRESRNIVVQGKDIQVLIQNLGVEGIRIDPKNYSDLENSRAIEVLYNGEKIRIDTNRKRDGSLEVFLRNSSFKRTLSGSTL